MFALLKINYSGKRQDERGKGREKDTERERERGVILLRTCEEFHVNGIFSFEIFNVQMYQGVKNKYMYLFRLCKSQRYIVAA